LGGSTTSGRGRPGAALIALILAAPLAAGEPPAPVAKPEAAPSPPAAAGLLPAAPPSASGALAATPPAAASPWQTLRFTDLGLGIGVPRGWSARREGDVRRIGPEGSPPVFELGTAAGLGADVKSVSQRLPAVLRLRGLRDARVRETVIGANALVLVSGSGLDACRYAYLPAPHVTAAVRLGPALCDAQGRLSRLGIAVLRSLRLFAPSE
jgi:hypothetical protein